MKKIRLSLMTLAVVFATGGAFATSFTSGDQQCDPLRTIPEQCLVDEDQLCCVDEQGCHQGIFDE